MSHTLDNPINTTRIVSYLGAVSCLADELAALGAKRPALVVDKGLADAGLVARWLPNEVKLVECARARVNPDLQDVEKALARAKEEQCDSVVALGGGSALCLGKALAVMLANGGDILEYEGFGKVHKRPAPTIAIPTTAGSGSEVSKALVLHQKGRPTEVVITANGNEPHVAILDGHLLASLPSGPMLMAGLDALTHCCEAMWVKRRTETTDVLAEKAFQGLSRLLPIAVAGKADIDTLQKLLEASTIANLACGGSGLGIVHALTSCPAIPLAHGYENGCVLLAAARFNRSSMSAKHAGLVDGLEKLFAQLDWPGHFKEDEVDAEQADWMVKATHGHPFRANNAREASDVELMAILRESGAQC